MQYRIEHVKGWKNPAIIRVKDGVIIGHIYVGHEDELKPYLGQGVDTNYRLKEYARTLHEGGKAEVTE